jgi:hypothetical protein
MGAKSMVFGFALLLSCARPGGIEGQNSGQPLPVEGTNLGAKSGIPTSSTGYYAVFTAANVVVYGKLVKADGEWLTLNDVHYVRSNMDPEKKQLDNRLVKRGNEWHKPTETFIARSQIILMEPVSQDSRIMAMIRDAR